MPQLDLNLLRVLIAIDERRSVSRAALALGMSQPSVSTALARLRQYFANPLFVRTPQGMEPTPRAIAMAEAARDVLRRFDREIDAAASFDPATTERPFTFALSDAGEVIFLPKLIARLTKLAPRAPIRSVSVPARDVDSGLESGEIDLAIGYFPDLKKHNFFQQRLFTDTFASLLRADHPISADKLTMRQFLQLGHAVVHAESRSQEVFERHLARRRVNRRIALHAPHFTSIPIVVAQSDLLVTVPQPLAVYFCSLTANLRTVALPFDIPRIDIKQYWHRKFHHDDRARWLRGLVSDLFQRNP